MNIKFIKLLKKNGVAIVPRVLDKNKVSLLKKELERSIEEDNIKYKNAFDKGMVHNCMLRGKNMFALLDHPVMNKYLMKGFSSTCILYAYQSSSLPPFSKNYGSRIHVDSPRFIKGYATNMGVFFPLDNFTLENGATYYLPGSHRLSKIPSKSFFYKNARRLICNAGDMILINARVVHAAGINNTEKTRHALTLNFCRSFMRQRFDFPRLLPKKIICKLGKYGMQLIGMNVRMPTNLEEFYLPEKERLYKSNQG